MSDFELTDEQEIWLSALESGQYRQGRGGFLRTLSDEFCCLGVACQLFDCQKSVSDYRSGEVRHFKYDDITGYAPDRIVQLLGLRNGWGPFTENWGNHANLAAANDGGKTFLEIATYIRANPERVFRVKEVLH